jgi:hypothetical protein
LEFRAVVVMACDEEIIPLQERIEMVGDDADLQEVYDTEAAPALRRLYPRKGPFAGFRSQPGIRIPGRLRERRLSHSSARWRSGIVPGESSGGFGTDHASSRGGRRRGMNPSIQRPALAAIGSPSPTSPCVRFRQLRTRGIIRSR